MKKALSFYLVVFCLLTQPFGGYSQKLRMPKGSVDETRSTTTAFDSLRVVRSKLADFKGVATSSGVLLQWQMQSETSILGYYIHRVDSSVDNIINPQIVFSAAATSKEYTVYGEKYSFVDRYGTASSAYYLETEDMNGNRFNSDTIQPSVGKRFPIDVTNVANNQEGTQPIESQAVRSDQLSLPKEVLLNVSEFNAPPNSEGQKYVASHAGARIDVKSEGIYRVTFAQLQAAGFDTNAPQANWQLYLNGAEQAITVDNSGGYVEFYGKGIDTVESDIQGYFLIVGETPGRRIQNLVARPSTSSVIQPNYNQTFQYKQRIFYLNTILNGSPENYWGNPIGGGAGMNVTFDLSGIDFNSPNARIQINVQGLTATSHTVRPTLNGQVLSNLTGVAQFPMSITVDIPTSLLKEGPNTLNLTSLGSGDTNIFDLINVSFARKQVAFQDQQLNGTLRAYAVNNKKTNLSGFGSSNVRVFDISNESDVRAMTNLPFENQGGTFGTVLPAARGKVYYAVEDSAIKAPFAVVNNDGEVLSSSAIGAQLIIISHKNFLAQAQSWANYRTGQGVTTKVVNVDEIYNEFGFGVLSSDAIKAFLNYAAHNWNPVPGYVLLIGDASFDSRNYQGDGYFNMVPPRMVTTVFEETASDEALADFDNDGLAELAIGRIPARSAAQVTNALSKVQNWEANLPADPLSRGILLASHWDTATPGDLADPETLFQEMSKRLRDQLPPSAPVTLMNSLSNPTPDLIASMNAGKYFVNYSGHGALTNWASTYFASPNVASLTNHNSESVYTMLTCLNGQFNNLRGVSLAETLLDWNNGGAVAAWSSSGKTTPDMQEVMALRFYNQVGIGNISRLGDLIKDAKATVVGGTDVRLSWALLGDPMLKVR